MSERLRIANQTTKGLVTFASCSDKELSFEYKEGQNGVFTAALLEVFKGKAVKLKSGEELSADMTKNGTVKTAEGTTSAIVKGHDDVVTINELKTYLTVRVPDLLQYENAMLRQTPQCSLNEMPENMTLFIIK